MTDNERIQRAEALHQIWQNIITELLYAEYKHPHWPGVGHEGDHVWAAALHDEERGELLKAAMNWQAHGRGGMGHMKQEAHHWGAMVVRFLLNVDAVERQRINESGTGPASLNEHYIETEHGDNVSWQWLDDKAIRYHLPAEELKLTDHTEGYTL